MSTSRPTRAESRAHMEAAILEAGRQQLATRGAANLSLREVARTIGVVSSAVYRYVSSKEELLTALLVDAYESLGDAVTQNLDPSAEPATRFRSIAHAMRDWALRHREQWALLYGSPVPGYAAPEERTTNAGTRVIGMLIATISEGNPPVSQPSEALTAWVVPEVEKMGVEASPRHIAFGIEAWGTLIGTISMELFGQLGPLPEELGDEIFTRTTESLIRRLTGDGA
ncbi:TetR/AcrR family transcriptional regulator [Kocuria sp. HSID16901]|uniref:TetR/AcrR family transcriptional regulator n=1 Tax=Kocuria sp. HSID16901 TaxID=2419505 RepID=UPI00080A9252|nr:TetR/AcrR family transcriptional regulator [Kocuria sp. HSID16901]RUQ21691.1 TetR/AcrR family transcriptional regulator [Kocuria sp. HSID16901]